VYDRSQLRHVAIMSNSIKVVARFRPQNRTEIELGGQPIVEFDSEDTCRLDVCI
jgi:kinesin family protein 5